MICVIIETKNPEETFALGQEIGRNAKPGQVYTLTGDLGVGKTVFTQGVAAGLGITEPVNSPTFTIVQVYEEGRLPFYHFDVYRIGDIEEMEEIVLKALIIDVLRLQGWSHKKLRFRIEEKNMKILGLDSSGIVASVAVVEDDILVAEYTVNYKKTHSQTLLPMLDEIAKMTELDLNTIDAIAVAAGPGSFTGLRIGSATAKGLGLALKKPLIAVPTVEGLAYNLYDTDGLICPIMDARRRQVYTGIYRFEEHRLVTVEDQMAVPMEEMIRKLNEYQQPVTFLGDGVPVFADMIAEKLNVPYSFAPAHVNKQRAAAVAALGLIYYKEGRTQTAMEHIPDYLRVSQAEREREERQKKEREAAQSGEQI